jgi:2-haloacid dehalogenase
MTRRRAFLSAALGAISLFARSSAPAEARSGRIKALALDGFTTFDPRPLAALAEELFPGKGAALSAAWRTRQFEYTWLRTAMQRYADFWTVTEQALVFAAEATGVELESQQRDRLMETTLRLPAYTDAKPALSALRDGGIRLAFLANLSPRMLAALIDHTGLRGLFEHELSTDAVRTYKPDPRAYRLAVDAFGLRAGEIGFVASAGWDAAGARAYGYPTFWINRPGQPIEQLGARADGVGTSLADLAGFLRAHP